MTLVTMLSNRKIGGNQHIKFNLVQVSLTFCFLSDFEREMIFSRIMTSYHRLIKSLKTRTRSHKVSRVTVL